MTRARPLATRWAAALVISLLPACASSPALPAPELLPEPGADQVERVLFMVGDAGKATTATSPLLHRLTQDVERWAGRLETDSAVAVLVLGDNIYPLGLNPADAPAFDHDTTVLMSQVRVVAGPAARARGARAYFLAGNHDWGLREDFPGFVRLHRMNDYLEDARQRTGAEVRMVPRVGTGGPFVLDWGEHARLLLLDTAWWLLAAEDLGEAVFLEQVEAAMRTAGGRQILIAAHHPFRTAGPHGGETSILEMLGLGYLLRRSGAMLQDLNSVPYQELERGLRAIFARVGPPLAFVGGHEHSLQVIGRVQPTDPRYSLVSGSASKLTGVGVQPGLRFARSAPGYMRLLILRDGRMHLSVVAAPDRYLLCPEKKSAPRECMLRGIASFETIHAQWLD